MAKPYPWYYAINDRPLMIARKPDGSAEMFAFDVTTGNLVIDRTHYEHVAPGSGKDLDELTAAQFSELVVARRVDLVGQWCERMCKLERVSQRELEALIGMPTDPLPLSANEVTIEGGDGVPAMISLALPEEIMRRRDLEARFGAAMVFPSPADDLMRGFAFEVKVPGAPHACTLFVGTLPDRPDPDADVRTLTLRLARDRGA